MKQSSDSSDSHMTSANMEKGNYWRLLIMAAVSFVAMYVLMYAMVDVFDNVYMNFNQVYMAGLMAAPMVLIELVVMRSMYRNSRLNALAAGIAAIAGLVFFLFIRQQTAVGDRQFLRSMIPHHASAILMCQQASITDAAIRNLCYRGRGIIESQQEEIEQMRAMLRRPNM